VKQSDLGEYKENVREKQTIHVYKSKAPTSPQIKSYGWQTSSSELKRVAEKAQGFSMQKTILSLNQGKSNQASNSTKDTNSP
jgi:hypothetical protein